MQPMPVRVVIFLACVVSSMMLSFELGKPDKACNVNPPRESWHPFHE